MRNQRSELPLHLQPSRTLSSTTMASSELSPSSYHERVKASHRVKAITERNKRSIKEENAVANALANRSYHLPDYGYWADLVQFLVNNHLLFGLCCRHPKHPIGTKQRAVNLLGSALCGLAITNLIWIGAIYFNEDPDDILFKVSFHGDESGSEEALFGNGTNATAIESPSFEIILPGLEDEATAQKLENTLQITKGMVLLWTLGGCLHATYDSAVWYASACACCLPGNRCESLGLMRRAGGYCIFFVVVLVAAAASFAVVLRITLMSDEGDPTLLQSTGLMDDMDREASSWDNKNNVGKYEFILSYFVEFALALFIYYPLFQIILFLGILNCLGCGRVRVLGGRPFEMKQLEQQQQVY